MLPLLDDVKAIAGRHFPYFVDIGIEFDHRATSRTDGPRQVTTGKIGFDLARNRCRIQTVAVRRQLPQQNALSQVRSPNTIKRANSENEMSGRQPNKKIVAGSETRRPYSGKNPSRKRT